MNLKVKLKDKRTVGLIANTLSIFFLFELMAETFDIRSNTLIEYILYLFISVIIAALCFSTYKLSRNMIQTKSGIIGKLFVFILSAASIYYLFIGKTHITNLKDFGVTLIVFLNSIFIPYSFYLFKKKVVIDELNEDEIVIKQNDISIINRRND